MKRLDSGGRSTFYAQTVSSRWFPRTDTQYVHIVREATLSEDLSQIEDRRLRAIRVYVGKEFGTEGQAVDLDREAVIHLRDALTLALDATSEEA